MTGTPERSVTRAPTIFDVAERAAVSHQTVSRVINGDPTVREPLRTRVTAAVAELGYRPRAAARALASRTSRALGVVSTGGALHGPASTALAFNQAARSAGYHVLTATLDRAEPDSMRDAVETLLAQDVTAIVLVAADSTATDALAALPVAPPVPVVIANGRAGQVAGWTSVAIDQAAGAELAVRHLLDRGRRRIAHLTGPGVSQEAVVRCDTYERLVRAAGQEPLVLPGDWTPESGYAAGRALDLEAVDAVFCGNDQMALGVLHAFADRGVRVPEDVALVGFDDIPEAAHFTPPLTTVQQDFASLGQRVLEAVVVVLTGGTPSDRTVAAELVVRAST